MRGLVDEIDFLEEINYKIRETYGAWEGAGVIKNIRRFLEGSPNLLIFLQRLREQKLPIQYQYHPKHYQRLLRIFFLPVVLLITLLKVLTFSFNSELSLFLLP